MIVSLPEDRIPHWRAYSAGDLRAAGTMSRRSAVVERLYCFAAIARHIIEVREDEASFSGRPVGWAGCPGRGRWPYENAGPSRAKGGPGPVTDAGRIDCPKRRKWFCIDSVRAGPIWPANNGRRVPGSRATGPGPAGYGGARNGPDEEGPGGFAGHSAAKLRAASWICWRPDLREP